MNRKYSGFLSLSLVLLFGGSPALAGEWVELFDGKSLEGWWNPYSWGDIEVADGEIRLTADKKFFLLTKDTYADFEFEAEIKLPEGKANSGFMFRAHQEPDRVWGYQAEVDPSDRAWSGGLYDEGRRGWLNPDKENQDTITKFKEAGNPFKAGEWNRYAIKCKGDQITISVNDTVTSDFRDEMDASGYIGLQHHGEKGQTYAFRNIRVRELDREMGEWKDLLGAADLAGWTNSKGEPAEIGAWVMEDGGVLHRKDKGGHLYSGDEYEDFELEFEWKVSEGANSGVKYRVNEYGGKVIGPEYQVLDDGKHPDAGKSDDRRAACLYDVVKAIDGKPLNPVGEWNRARVVADGTRLGHYLNGVKVVEADTASKLWGKQIDDSKYQGIDDYGTRAGRILIQDHGDPVWYRNMRIRELR